MRITKREKSNTFSKTDVLEIHSSEADFTFLVSVTLPDGPTPENGWPVLLALDGNYSVGTVIQSSYFLSLEGGMPPSVIVSVGYPLTHPIIPRFARNQHLTEGHWPEFDETYASLLGCDAPPPSGAAPKFTHFLLEELKPFVASSYSTDPNQWTLIGHSFGGLCATNLFLDAPDSFRGYLVCGAAYWWKRRQIFSKLDTARATSTDTQTAFYIAAGGDESKANMERQWEPFLNDPKWQRYLNVLGGVPDITSDSSIMASTLNDMPGVQTVYNEFEGESHGTAFFRSLSLGLSWLHKSSAYNTALRG